MRRIWFFLRAIVIAMAVTLLHYVLPQHDVARIVSTEIIRMDFSSSNRMFFAQPDSAADVHETRDIRLINTERKKSFLLGFVRRDSEGVMVYRNEDTGWFWPPYFKFDSSDLQATASANISTLDREQWVVVTHYGWRIRFLSIYPNAVGIRPIDGPEFSTIPWFNIIFLTFLLIGYFLFRVVWRRFRDWMYCHLPGLSGDAIGQAEDRMTATKGRIQRWFGSWRERRR